MTSIRHFPILTKAMFLALLSLIHQSEGYLLASSHTHTHQTAASPQSLDGGRHGPVVAAASGQSRPPPLDTDVVHVFDVSLGGPDTAKLALTQVSNEKKGVLALWRFMMAHEAGGEAERLDRARDELQAEFALAADASVFGAYLNGGVDGDEHGLALVRFDDADDDADGKRVMQHGRKWPSWWAMVGHHGLVSMHLKARGSPPHSIVGGHCPRYRRGAVHLEPRRAKLTDFRRACPCSGDDHPHGAHLADDAGADAPGAAAGAGAVAPRARRGQRHVRPAVGRVQHLSARQLGAPHLESCMRNRRSWPRGPRVCDSFVPAPSPCVVLGWASIACTICFMDVTICEAATRVPHPRTGMACAHPTAHDVTHRGAPLTTPT